MPDTTHGGHSQVLISLELPANLKLALEAEAKRRKISTADLVVLLLARAQAEGGHHAQ